VSRNRNVFGGLFREKEKSKSKGEQQTPHAPLKRRFGM